MFWRKRKKVEKAAELLAKTVVRLEEEVVRLKSESFRHRQDTEESLVRLWEKLMEIVKGGPVIEEAIAEGRLKDLQETVLVMRAESQQRYEHMITLGKRVSEIEQEIEELKQKE